MKNTTVFAMFSRNSCIRAIIQMIIIGVYHSMESAVLQRQAVTIGLVEKKRRVLNKLIADHEWDLTHPAILAVSEELDDLIIELQIDLPEYMPAIKERPKVRILRSL